MCVLSTVKSQPINFYSAMLSSTPTQSSLTPSQSSDVLSSKKGSRNSKCHNKSLVESYWTRVSMDDTIYKCNICQVQRKQKDKSGHGNLINHLTTNHPEIMIITEPLSCNQPTLESFVSVKASQVYGWMDFMTMKDIPFLWSKPGETNKYLKLPTMDPRTIKNFMHKTGTEIESIVRTSVIRKKNGEVVPLVML